MNFFRVCLVLMLALVMAMAQQQTEGSNLRGVEKADIAPAANTTVPADGDDKLLTGGGTTLGAPGCIFTGLFTPFCLFQRKWEQLTHKN